MLNSTVLLYSFRLIGIFVHFLCMFYVFCTFIFPVIGTSRGPVKSSEKMELPASTYRCLSTYLGTFFLGPH